MSETAAEYLADHYASLKFEDIPDKHIQDAKVLVRDYLGTVPPTAVRGPQDQVVTPAPLPPSVAPPR